MKPKLGLLDNIKLGLLGLLDNIKQRQVELCKIEEKYNDINGGLIEDEPHRNETTSQL